MPSNAGTNTMPLRRTIIRGVAATGLGLAAPWFYIKAPRAADPKRLNAYNYDGVVGKFYADYWIKPFEEKFDVKVDTVQVSASLVPLDKLMAQIAAGRPESDYVPLQPTQMIIAVRNNALMKLGSDKLPAGRDWDSDYLSDYGPKAVPYAYGLAYDKEKVKKPPTSWKEMWSPEMKKQVSINDAAFEQALQMVNLTFTGKTTPVDADTFKHLDDLRPNIVTLWTTGAQIEQLLPDARGDDGPLLERPHLWARRPGRAGRFRCSRRGNAGSLEFAKRSAHGPQPRSGDPVRQLHDGSRTAAEADRSAVICFAQSQVHLHARGAPPHRAARAGEPEEGEVRELRGNGGRNGQLGQDVGAVEGRVTEATMTAGAAPLPSAGT